MQTDRFSRVHGTERKEIDKMAFERLERLGPEKYERVVNELMRATPAAIVARMIQQEWGDFQDVSEDLLAKHLKRLHAVMTNDPSAGIWWCRPPFHVM